MMGLYNPVIVQSQETSNTASIASPSSHQSSTIGAHLLEVNVNRKGAIIFNASTANLFIQFGPVGENTVDNYSVKIAPGGYYEVPVNYIGIIGGIWDEANGSAKIVEFT